MASKDELLALGAKLFEEEQKAQPQTPGRMGPGGVFVPDPSFLEKASMAAPEQGMGHSVMNFVKEGALPAIGAAIGTTGGLPGEMAGAALGETLNQAIGIGDDASVTDMQPDLSKVGMAGASPVAGRAVSYGARNLPKLIPGTGAGLHELAGETLEQLPNTVMDPQKMVQFVRKVAPKADLSPVAQTMMQKGPPRAGQTMSDYLFELTDELSRAIPGQPTRPNIMITADNLKAATLKLAQQGEELMARSPQLAKAIKEGAVKRIRDEMSTIIQQGNGKVDFSLLRQQWRALNQLIGSSQQGPEYGAYKLLKGAMIEDLKAAAAQSSDVLPAAVTFRAANEAFKRETAQGILQDLYKRTVTERGSDLLTSVNRGAYLKSLKTDKELQKLLPKAELDDLIATVKGIGILPSLPPPPDAPFGSGGLARRGLEGALGAVAATGGMDPASMSAGAFVTAAAGEILSKVLVTPSGRNLVKAIAKGGGDVFSPQAMSILSAFVNGGFADME